jgi:hypothetical protein
LEPEPEPAPDEEAHEEAELDEAHVFANLSGGDHDEDEED